MVRTQIQLTEKQAAALKRLAKVRDISMAEVIRQSVDEYLKRKAVVSREEKKRRALAVIGKFRSQGDGDVAEKHDRYLAKGVYDGVR